MKRFPLLWFFVTVGFIAVALVTVLVATLLNQRAEDRFLKRSESQGVSEVGYMRQMFYDSILAPELEMNPELAIADAVDPAMMDGFAMRTTLRANVEDISVFDPEGNIVYSTDPHRVGLTESETGLFQQALQGAASASVVSVPEVTGPDGETHDRDVLSSYIAVTDTVPGSAEPDSIIGILSVSRDVTEELATVKADALQEALIASIGTGGVLFLTLFLIVLRADRIIAGGYRRQRAQQEELEQAAAKLARSNAELEDFTYAVSHDLKEPLRGIEAFSGFLAEDYADKLDDEGQRHIAVLQESAVRMKDLIDDLLGLSRMDSSRREYAPVHIGRLLTEVHLDLDFALQAKSAHLRIQPDLPTVTCQRTHIKQLFKNLISNAIKFSDTPKPVIEIGCERNNGFYTFSVRDNGIGIDEKYHDRIFRVFQRLHQRDEYEGTGIGLSICKKAVEAHGGNIWVESNVGEGSTFSFTIPATLQQTEQEEENL